MLGVHQLILLISEYSLIDVLFSLKLELLRRRSLGENGLSIYTVNA